MFTGALVAGLLVGAPAAHAAFNTTVTATMKTSAHTMAVPVGNTVAASCEPIGGSGKYRLWISVSGHGTVARANNYVLRMVSPSGTVTDTDLKSGSAAYNSGSSSGAEPGTWTYSIEAQYQVPGSTNVWTSTTAVPSTINC